jgi:hypothetical protein
VRENKKNHKIFTPIINKIKASMLSMKYIKKMRRNKTCIHFLITVGSVEGTRELKKI